MLLVVLFEFKNPHDTVAPGNFPTTGLTTEHDDVTTQSFTSATTRAVTVVANDTSDVITRQTSPDEMNMTTSSTSAADGDETSDRFYCEQATVRDVDWPRTASGTTAVEPCPNTSNGNV
jgi:hypothetical protein